MPGIALTAVFAASVTVLTAEVTAPFPCSKIPSPTLRTRASGDLAAEARLPPVFRPTDDLAVDVRPPLFRPPAAPRLLVLRVDEVPRVEALLPRFAVLFDPARFVVLFEPARLVVLLALERLVVLLAPARFAVDLRVADFRVPALAADLRVPVALRAPVDFPAVDFRVDDFRVDERPDAELPVPDRLLLFRPPAALLLRPPLRVLLALAPRFDAPRLEAPPVEDFRPPAAPRERVELDEPLLRDEPEVLPDDFEPVAIISSWWRFADSSARIAHKQSRVRRATARAARRCRAAVATMGRLRAAARRRAARRVPSHGVACRRAPRCATVRGAPAGAGGTTAAASGDPPRRRAECGRVPRLPRTSPSPRPPPRIP